MAIHGTNILGGILGKIHRFKLQTRRDTHTCLVLHSTAPRRSSATTCSESKNVDRKQARQGRTKSTTKVYIDSQEKQANKKLQCSGNLSSADGREPIRAKSVIESAHFQSVFSSSGCSSSAFVLTQSPHTLFL